MFYYPNRTQAIHIQETLKTIYAGVGGEYYFCKEAWEVINQKTDVDLLSILKKIADQKTEPRD